MVFLKSYLPVVAAACMALAPTLARPEEKYSMASVASVNASEAVLQPFNYLLASPGKSFRTKFIQAFDYWLQVPKADLKIITNVVDKLHTASLLIDDIEDDSEIRRGIPAAHKVHGIPATLNSANYVYFLALQDIVRMNKSDLVTVFTEELIALHEGQGMDIYWRDNSTCPSENEYLAMVANKTGGLLRLAVKMMQHCSDSNVDYIDLVNNFGVYFQVRDDFMNLRSAEYSDKKGFCEDIEEGKFSFPVVHSINENPKDHRLVDILKEKTNDTKIKREALAIMAKTDSFNYTLEYLNQRENEIRASIQEFDGNPLLEKAMDMLHLDANSSSFNTIEEEASGNTGSLSSGYHYSTVLYTGAATLILLSNKIW